MSQDDRPPGAAMDDARLVPYRRALSLAAALNGVMFVVEAGGALYANSIALMADAIDFLEDTITYLLAAVLIGLGARPRVLFGAATAFLMFVPGIWIAWKTVDQLLYGFVPDPLPMGAIGLLALAVNVYCAFLLMPHREGDSAHQGVWLSTRNDAIANVAIVIAAIATALFESIWPDVVVGLGIAALNLYAAGAIALLAWREWRDAPPDA
jgi:Co/Zn/Cd efflux system component